MANKDIKNVTRLIEDISTEAGEAVGRHLYQFCITSGGFVIGFLTNDIMGFPVNTSIPFYHTTGTDNHDLSKNDCIKLYNLFMNNAIVDMNEDLRIPFSTLRNNVDPLEYATTDYFERDNMFEVHFQADDNSDYVIEFNLYSDGTLTTKQVDGQYSIYIRQIF